MKQLFAADVSAKETTSGRSLQPLVGGTSLVDLNLLTQKIFASVDLDLRRLQAVVRCDQLPQVFGQEDRLEKLFHHLLFFVTQLPATDSKLFIYLKTSGGNLEATPQGELKEWTINLHSNRTIPLNWEEQNKEKLKECSEICSEQQSQFIFHTKNTGCLFTLIMPGVLNTSHFG